jgi:hypothetical protein
VHFGEDFGGEGFRDAVEVDAAAGFADALGLGLSQLLDVAVGGVLEGELLVIGCERVLGMPFDRSMVGRPLNG